MSYWAGPPPPCPCHDEVRRDAERGDGGASGSGGMAVPCSPASGRCVGQKTGYQSITKITETIWLMIVVVPYPHYIDNCAPLFCIRRSWTNLEMAWQVTNFRWHTPWSVRLCNRNSKSAKSSFQSKKKKIKSCSIKHGSFFLFLKKKHGSFRQVWCTCISEYFP